MTAGAPGVRELQRHVLLRAIAVARLGLRNHEARNTVLLGAAARFRQPGETLGHERLELVDSIHANPGHDARQFERFPTEGRVAKIR